MSMPEYRIVVDALDPTTGEGGLESLSFFASTHNDIFAAIGSVRGCLNCSASSATRLAVALSLLSHAMHEQTSAARFTSLRQAALEFMNSLEPLPALETE